jgi:hypothetical protein
MSVAKDVSMAEVEAVARETFGPDWRMRMLMRSRALAGLAPAELINMASGRRVLMAELRRLPPATSRRRGGSGILDQ